MAGLGSLYVAEIKTYARIFGKQCLPVETLDWLRQRSLEYRRSSRKSSVVGAPMTRNDLVLALRALGLAAGRDVLVHSAMSALGPVEGGAATVYGAIAEVVGPEATILVPAYPMPGTMSDWMSAPDTFDVQRSRSRMGAFTEYVRTLPGAVRSAHPTHSIAAIGPRAQDYVREHHLDGTPAGPRSPFALHMRNAGQILCLGTGVGKITSYHVIEDIETDFPVAPYLEDARTKKVQLADGTSCEVATFIHDPALSPWRIDNFAPKEAQIRQLMLRDAILRESRIGLARASLVDAAGLLKSLAAWAKTGITIYHSPVLPGIRSARRRSVH